METDAGFAVKSYPLDYDWLSGTDNRVATYTVNSEGKINSITPVQLTDAAVTALSASKIDLTTATAPVLTFDQAINHAKGTAATTLTLWVKEASATEWTQLTIPSYPSSDSWTFYAAGEVDLSAYVGKSIQIAYKYTSTTSIASTWEVKNVNVVEK